MGRRGLAWGSQAGETGRLLGWARPPRERALGKEEAPQRTLVLPSPPPEGESEGRGPSQNRVGGGPRRALRPRPGQRCCRELRPSCPGPLAEAGVGMSSQARSLARWPNRPPGPGGVSGGILAPWAGVGGHPPWDLPTTSPQQTSGHGRRLGSEASGLCSSVTLDKSFLYAGPLVCP